jgi:3,4-dihydroxy 2-butanone 4-phosphate synthase/GTP cyclohydrolase II
MTEKFKLASIEQIIEDAKNGKMFIIIDDEDRENEGDLVIPGEFADANAVNFMATHGRGLICLTLNEDRIRELNIPQMSPFNNSRHGTAFTISIEAREGITTGISAADRSRTIKDAIDKNKGAEAICSPGHVFPLVARNGGVLTRTGHTEASVDIAKLAGLNPSGVICEIMNDDGTMARLPDLVKFAQKHDLNIASIADLISYRRKSESLVREKVKAKITTKYGEFEIIIYYSESEYAEHIVLKKGNLDYSKPVLVRMHSQDVMSDILGDLKTGKAEVLDKSMELISKEGGILVLLRSPQKNLVSETIFMREKSLNSKTEKNYIRDYGIGAQILKDLGVEKMKLITNSKKSIIGLESYGLTITDYVSID